MTWVYCQSGIEREQGRDLNLTHNNRKQYTVSKNYVSRNSSVDINFIYAQIHIRHSLKKKRMGLGSTRK